MIIIAGFIFRLKGIVGNHSFWSDEAFVSGLSRDILTGERSYWEAVKFLNYQPLYILLTTVSLKIFGFDEFAARLPIVFIGTLGIAAAYLLAKKLSDEAGGLLAAFLYAFSQLNLAHHTQAKSTTIIQSILLINLYLLTLFKKDRRNLHLHALVILLSVTSTLFHFIGILVWIPYLVYITLTVKFSLKRLIFLLLPLIGVFYISSGPSKVYEFLKANDIGIFLSMNNAAYIRELLLKNYGMVFLPAVVGIIIGIRNNRNLVISVFIWSMVLLYLWTRYYHNIRYLLPFIGIMFVYFGVFWSHVGNQIFSKKSGLVCLIIAMLIFIGGDKFVRKPLSYYNPNRDLYGDVQMADYKTTYKLMQNKFPGLSSIAVLNDWRDTQYWYLPQKPVTAYFTVGIVKPNRNVIDKHWVYGSLTDFIREKNKYPRGLLVVEDWMSLLPEDIKQYAKKNLRLELRVDSLAQAPDDPWPMAVYSWGFD